MNLPFFKRKLFCVGISTLAACIVAFTLPTELIAEVPMVRAATIINGMIIGTLITVAGFVTWHPIFKFRIHPILRGSIMAAFVHLDFTIYTWSNQPLFWKTMIIAAMFGAVIDMMATQLYGEGETLMEGMTK
ncbi:hypothetical protein KJ652_00645 [Patescibacteria group bacterium]|nr:hypothetical protein [Patescibacteria group bacterium]MBU1123080.1 hypothetical protein [Patescibacteria group bacterium]MBU1910968.1 hypothetical protein [Patescibacteria group bacterium]